MYFDSGATRSVISENSIIKPYLKNVQPTTGSCSIGNGQPLHYLQRGIINKQFEITVVKDLKYDLYSAVSAAKLGISSIIDYDMTTGKNNSYTIDKTTGEITPLIERGRGILELPLHLGMDISLLSADGTNKPKEEDTTLSPNLISIFWDTIENKSFDHAKRENNTTEFSLFTFDILRSLNQREQDFLIHARLGHIPREKILQLIKNGTTGIESYSGKFKELCKPCMQAKHRAENHGHQHTRHPEGKPGEHLHSDLAVVSTPNLNGNKNVLTVVDEISKEIMIALLKRKTAAEVNNTCRQILAIIWARTENKLKTWQFDRGTEFLNSHFSKWIMQELGATQRFSNVEHPWENGVAERSFETLFGIARSLLKHADLLNTLWGKAILHSVFLKNRTPTESCNGMSPLQFRTKE
jgi:transposase InsO family protein